MKTIVIALAWSLAFSIRAGSVDGWTAVAPREEIRRNIQAAGLEPAERNGRFELLGR